VPRPRQISANDCVLAVFREITGSDEDTAKEFLGHHQMAGQAGFLSSALSSCLMDAGFMLTSDDSFGARYVGSNGDVDETKFKAVWSAFRGVAVVAYTTDDEAIGHTIVVRSGGIAFDPDPAAPEDGEFIFDHFEHTRRNIKIKEVSTITRMLE
jgi:hypothetical protein